MSISSSFTLTCQKETCLCAQSASVCHTELISRLKKLNKEYTTTTATNKEVNKPKLLATFREPKLQNGTISAPDTSQETRERKSSIYQLQLAR